MFYNYLKIAFRSLLKNKLFSFINIFGLALSISVCVAVIINLKDYLNYDTFHPHPESTFRIITETKNKEGNRVLLASSPLPMEDEVIESKPLIEDAVTIYPAFKAKGVYNEKSLSVNGAFTDPSFFEIFGFNLLQGDEKTALKGANQLVLNKKTAEKFFGTESPIGKVIEFEKLGNFMVTGVLDELPGKSHIDFEVYASMASVPLLEKEGSLRLKLSNWFSFYDGYTYVRLKKGFSENDLNNLLESVSKKVSRLSNKQSFAYSAQRLDRITPGTDDMRNNIGKGTVWSKVWAEVAVGLIILLSACFNYTNLTLSRALTRSKEVGIRKVAGAQRYQVFLQYITEAVLVSIFSLLVGLFIYSVIQTSGQGEIIPEALSLDILLWTLLFAVATGLMAGSLPAWILSSFKPANVLKNISTIKVFGSLTLRKVLIVFQFSLSLIIIIFLTAYYQQFTFMDTINPGFRRESIVSIPLEGADKEILKNEISQVSGVEGISFTSTNFGRHETGITYIGIDKESKSAVPVNYYYIDENTVPVMNLQIAAGQNLNVRENEDRYILINEKTVIALGFKNNQEAVGKELWYDTSKVVVKGVIKDFYFHNVGNPIRPLALKSKNDAYNFMNISVNTADRNGLAKQLENAWKKAVPKQPFSYIWLDESNASSGQESTYSFLAYLAFIAIAIAVLGLLGLVIYTVETRKKEIGIRKIVGASVFQITKLFSAGFARLLMISGIIALPLGYIVTYIFLQNFYNRISYGIGSLLLCFIFLFTIGIFTIISQTLPAASANPVKGLRDE